MSAPSVVFDPDRDLPRPISMSLVTDEEVEAKVKELEQQNPNVSRSTILHRVLRHALVGTTPAPV